MAGGGHAPAPEDFSPKKPQPRNHARTGTKRISRLGHPGGLTPPTSDSAALSNPPFHAVGYPPWNKGLGTVFVSIFTLVRLSHSYGDLPGWSGDGVVVRYRLAIFSEFHGGNVPGGLLTNPFPCLISRGVPPSMIWVVKR